MNGNPSRVNIKQLCGRRWHYNLIPAESKFKNLMLDHQDKYMMKAQVHVSKSSVISDIQALPRRKYFYYHVVKQELRGRLLASFQDLEHEGGDTRIGKGKEVGGPSVNMTEKGGKNKHQKQKKGKKRSNEENNGSGSNKKPKLECWKCGKTGYFKRDFRSGKKNNANAGGSGKGFKDQSQDQGTDDGVTTSLQLSRNSRPLCSIIKDKYMMKAQVHVLKSSAIFDEQPRPRRKYHCQNDKSIKW
nr:zinc finger, CCHC-type [Tanacetum cinerariifolium]